MKAPQYVADYLAGTIDSDALVDRNDDHLTKIGQDHRAGSIDTEAWHMASDIEGLITDFVYGRMSAQAFREELARL